MSDDDDDEPTQTWAEWAEDMSWAAEEEGESEA